MIINDNIIKGGNILKLIFLDVQNYLKTNITTLNLDNYIAQKLAFYNCESAPKKEYNFPGFSCISVNDCLCHGIPSDYIIKHGDLVSIDISFYYNDYFFDAGRSFVILDSEKIITPNIHKRISLVSFNIFIFQQTIIELNKLYKKNLLNNKKTDYCEIGRIFEKYIYYSEYAVLKSFGGHKIGKKLHLTPFISSCNDAETNVFIQEGDTFCFEPVISYKINNKLYIDYKYLGKWEVLHANKEVASHYENTFYVINDNIVSILD